MDVPPEVNLPFIDFLRSVSRAGSVRMADKAEISPIRCVQRPKQRLCQGRTAIIRLADSIHWACTVCGTEGILSGWRGTPWDLSLSVGVDTSTHLSLCVSQAEYNALTRVLLSSAEEDLILAHAGWRDGRVVMTGGYDAFETLSGSITSEANHTKDRRLREDLDGVAELLDVILRHSG